MSKPFCAFCEDFYVNLRLGSQLNLPHTRETVLHFFERVQKTYPGMTRFRRSENNEFTLEEDRSSQSYRWVSLETKRLAAGYVNPPSFEDAVSLHSLLLEQSPYQLGISPLEIDYLDVLLGFDLPFSGNHDEVIAESLYGDSPLACLGEEMGARAVDVQPTVTFALNDDCRLQARMDVVTRTNSYQVRTGEYSEDMISVYLIMRRYWGDRPKEPIESLFAHMTERAAELANKYIVPRVLKPISDAIASRS